MRPRTWKQIGLSILLIFVIFGVVTLASILFRSWDLRLLLPIGLLVYLGTALNRGRSIVTPPRFPLFRDRPEDYGLEYFEDVGFVSRDGLELSGWYIPGQNGAAVVLVHTWGGDRTKMRLYARPLAANGYSILMFDLRAHCRSAGFMSTWGWQEVNDLLGAVDFAAARPEVDPDRIGVAAVALGAQIALRAAADCEQIQAVWADRPLPAVLKDHRDVEKVTLRQRFFQPWFWISYQVVAWLTGARQPEALLDAVSRISPRPILIVASGKEREVEMVRRFYAQAGEPKTLWQLDNLPLGSGVLERGDEYDLRIVNFFNRTLSSDQTSIES